MAEKEILQPNVVEPTLFVGVGGIGSRIIKKVADKCLNDKVDNIRFVVLDTDVNDLTRLENGSVITTVQTSSTRSIKDYLDFDTDARDNWFPKNRILDSKTVSEGAGQVRAISRLALNATIRQGTIAQLYNAIDDLYLKDGGDKSRAVKVVIASTVAGGTGSGIALEAAMVIRDYLTRNYPESAAIIRGFFIMPGVMDTVISTESERQSLRRNGYATIKEINAFMMKGSGFFESNPELRRYKDLCLTVPSTNGPSKQLDNLPFDFCFLLDRIDSKQHSMQSLAQYENFAAQSIYEQNIGPMRKSASSKEDNIVKEFIVPEKLGRCRFGGAGASVMKYPYEKIVDYVALNWAEKAIIGVNNENASDEDKQKMVMNSWLRYDYEFKTELNKFENDIHALEKDKPVIEKMYMSLLENSTDSFSEKIRSRYLDPKFNSLSSDNIADADMAKKMSAVAEDFINSMKDEIALSFEKMISMGDGNEESSTQDVKNIGKTDAEIGSMVSRYNAINNLMLINRDEERLKEKVKEFAKANLKSENSILREPAKYQLEAYLRVLDKVLHPNAVRYLLYKLADKMQEIVNDVKADKNSYEESIAEITEGKETEGKPDKKKFQVNLNITREQNLEQMCASIDDKNKIQEAFDGTSVGRCNEMLMDLYNVVTGYYEKFAKRHICEIGLPIINSLSKSYQKFYDTFESKVNSIEKQKESIVDEVRFNNGDCELNLFSSKEMLEMVVRDLGTGTASAQDESDLFAKIYDATKANTVVEEKTKDNPLLRETKTDIFDEVIIGYYQKLVEKNCDVKIDLDILHALKYEFEIDNLVKLEKEANDDKREAIKKYSKDKSSINNYIKKRIDLARNLASSGIAKNDFEEARDVNAIAWSTNVKDGNGVYASEFPMLEEKNRSASVSKRELRFFSSIYNVMPTQISKLSYGKPVDENEKYDIIRKASGDYFNAYQMYMEKIGPDSKLNPVITPHIDKRWNSISVMPELDLEYQRDLMKYIHTSFVYGLLYKAIERKVVSEYKMNDLIYRFTHDGNTKDMIVSNGTKCDELYEVLDALYFDRATVNAIKKISDGIRQEDENKSTQYEETTFKKAVEDFSRTYVVGGSDEKEIKELSKTKTSLFEIPVLYYASLPAKKKDAAEIATMVDAIVEIIHREIQTFCNIKDVDALLEILVTDHYKLLIDNVSVYSELLSKSKDVIGLIRESIILKFREYDITIPSVFNKR